MNLYLLFLYGCMIFAFAYLRFLKINSCFQLFIRKVRLLCYLESALLKIRRIKRAKLHVPRKRQRVERSAWLRIVDNLAMARYMLPRGRRMWIPGGTSVGRLRFNFGITVTSTKACIYYTMAQIKILTVQIYQWYHVLKRDNKYTLVMYQRKLIFIYLCIYIWSYSRN